MEKVRIIPFRKWFRATIHGFILGIIPHIVLYIILTKLFLLGRSYNVVAFVGAVAYMQYKVLSKARLIGKEWIWVAIAGFLIPYVLIDMLEFIVQWHSDYDEIIPALKFLLSHVVIGVLQSEVLKKLHFKSTYVYTVSIVVVCLAGFLMSFFIDTISMWLGLEVELFDIPMSILIACMYGGLTGLALDYIQEQTFTYSDVSEAI